MTVHNNTVTGLAQQVKTEHPTGALVVIASLLVLVASKLGVELSSEEAALIVGAVGLIVSKLTPRFDAKAATASNIPSNGGTGPDEA